MFIYLHFKELWNTLSCFFFDTLKILEPLCFT